MKDYSSLTSRIYTQLSPELSQEFHSMLTDMEQEISRLYEIENAKPSIALEKVNHILSLFGGEKVQIETMTLSKCNILTIKQALMKAEEQEKVLKEIIKIINDLEPTFNRKGVSSDTDILGTIIKDYFYDNASDLLKGYFENE